MRVIVHYAICLAPSAQLVRAVLMNKSPAMLLGRLDQVPEHLLAGVKGLNGALAGVLFAAGPETTCRVARKMA
jgi:hypothetical protein